MSWRSWLLRPSNFWGAACLIIQLGCHRPARTPEEAFSRLEQAVAHGDAVALFACLDQATRWSVESTYHAEQLMRTIIAGKYPEGAAAAALAPLSAAAEGDAAHYFARVAAAEPLLDGLRQRLGATTAPLSRRADGGALYLSRGQGGAGLRFQVGTDGSWGLAELDLEWTRAKERASHALSTVRENATLYDGQNQRAQP